MRLRSYELRKPNGIASASQKIAPMYPDRRVTLVEGEETLRSWATFWFERALFCSNQRTLLSAAKAEWEAAGRPAGGGLIFPYKLYFLQTPEHAIIAADTGIGKTRFVLEHFLREGLHREYRLYFVAPNHDKAREVERDYLKLAAEMKIANAHVVVFEGLKRACKPPNEKVSDNGARNVGEGSLADEIGVHDLPGGGLDAVGC